MSSFPKRYGIYLAATLYLLADYWFGGPLTRRAPSADRLPTGPLAATAYGMPLPQVELEQAVRHHREQRGLSPTPRVSPGLELRTTDSLLANAILRTWVKDEGTFFPGTEPTAREDAWVEEKLAPSLEVGREELAAFLQQHPGLPEPAARQHLASARRPSATRALQRQILLNAAENIQR